MIHPFVIRRWRCLQAAWDGSSVMHITQLSSDKRQLYAADTQLVAAGAYFAALQGPPAGGAAHAPAGADGSVARTGEEVSSAPAPPSRPLTVAIEATEAASQPPAFALLPSSAHWPLSSVLHAASAFTAILSSLTAGPTLTPVPTLSMLALTTPAFSRSPSPSTSASINDTSMPSHGAAPTKPPSGSDPWVNELVRLGVTQRSRALSELRRWGQALTADDAGGGDRLAAYLQATSNIMPFSSAFHMTARGIATACVAQLELPPGVVMLTQSVPSPDEVALMWEREEDFWPWTQYMQWPATPCSVIGLPHRCVLDVCWGRGGMGAH